MKKILTVSIAAYNVQDYIDEALNSFVNVKEKERLEVLIVDDGSTDNTLEIARKYESDYPEVFKVVHKKNGGWGSTVTTGIQNATGKYFKQLDGDDYYNKDDLAAFLDELEKCESDMVVTAFTKFYDGTNKSVIVDNPYYTTDKVKNSTIDEIPVFPYSIEMYALTFKTALLKANNISVTEHCFYTDNEYVFRSCNCCKSVTIMPYSIYCYRLARPGQSVSVEGMKRHYKEFEYVLRTLLCLTKNETKNLQLQKIYYERLRSLSYYYFEMLVLMENKNSLKQEFVEYDLWLKKEFPEIYEGIRYLPLVILRKTNYFGYSFIIKQQKKRIELRGA
ncbi:MAG: glycosyltransferase family 2 protein [Ruminococcus sp.]|nr:glycosyltransferase family 2 protein [Ruminococcus sp.]